MTDPLSSETKVAPSQLRAMAEACAEDGKDYTAQVFRSAADQLEAMEIALQQLLSIVGTGVGPNHLSAKQLGMVDNAWRAIGREP